MCKDRHATANRLNILATLIVAERFSEAATPFKVKVFSRSKVKRSNSAQQQINSRLGKIWSKILMMYNRNSS